MFSLLWMLRPHYRRTDIGSYKWCTTDMVYARNIPFYSKQQTRILKESKSKKYTDTYFKFKIKMYVSFLMIYLSEPTFFKIISL